MRLITNPDKVGSRANQKKNIMRATYVILSFLVA